MDHLDEDLEARFQSAADWLTTSPTVAQLPNEDKLEIYGLYKVVMTGPSPDTPTPSFFALPATKAKYSAWVSQGKRYGTRIDDARRRYLDVAESLGWKEGEPPSGKKGLGGASVSVMRGESEEDGRESSAHPALVAASNGNLAELQRLVAADPSLAEIEDENGSTPLHLAADRGHVDIATWLLQQGASRSKKDGDGMTPYDVARLIGRDDMLELLRPEGDV